MLFNGVVLRKSFLGSFFIFLALAAGSLFPAAAQATGSASYQIQEDFIGGGGTVDASSANYKSLDSIGSTAGVGGAASATYQSHTGATTTNDPSLTFAVTSSSVNLGTLSNTLTRTGTATFSVLNYTSYGYVVQIVGDPPDSGAHTLAGMNPAASSSIGTEQFGINLVANTTPSTFGADPQQMPDATFGFGQAASGYNTTNLYKYVNGDVIASAPKSSGKTTFTISYVANIAYSTPNGSYSGNQTLVAIGTY